MVWNFLAGCDYIDNAAKDKLWAAGVPPELQNDETLLWAAANGATDQELRAEAANILQLRELKLRQAQNQPENNSPEPTETAEVEEREEQAWEKPVVIKQVTQGVYSFTVSDNVEITDPEYINRLRTNLATIIDDFANRDIFVAVKDDDAGEVKIFTASTIQSYAEENGPFYAYPGDEIFVASYDNSSALSKWFKSLGQETNFIGVP